MLTNIHEHETIKSLVTQWHSYPITCLDDETAIKTLQFIVLVSLEKTQDIIDLCQFFF